MIFTFPTNEIQPDGTFKTVRVECDNFADFLARLEPEREVGNASDGVGWVGDYGDGRILAIDTFGFKYYFSLLGRHKAPVVMPVEGYGDEDGMRAVVEHLGWSWSDVATSEDHERFYICDECATWVANGDDSSHDLSCDCGLNDEACEVRTSRYGTFDAWDEVSFETTPIRSGYYRCFGCGVDSIDPHAYIVREVGR